MAAGAEGVHLPRAQLEPITRRLWSRVHGDPALRLYAVLDAARNERIYHAVTATVLDYCCLYRGNIPTALAKAAPYLVQLPYETGFLDYLVSRGWGNSWGLYLTSTASLDDLRRHLRRFLRVKDEAGRRLVFRYYDPRVMRVFLPTCDEKQLEALFAEVESFLVEDEKGLGMTEYTLVDSRLASTPLS